jgi:hypothetical protein
MEPRDIIFDYFNDPYIHNSHLDSLMQYLDTDTLVAWFVDEGYIDELSEEEAKVVQDHYDKHCY